MPAVGPESPTAPRPCEAGTTARTASETIARAAKAKTFRGGRMEAHPMARLLNVAPRVSPPKIIRDRIRPCSSREGFTGWLRSRGRADLRQPLPSGPPWALLGCRQDVREGGRDEFVFEQL